jgi:protein-S-isoprenylcysteine O-methyltransferase Ste14
MKERSKAAIIVLVLCICGAVIPQTLTSFMHDKGWADAISLFSVLGAVIAFFFALIVIWQDGEKNESEDDEP